ncbi:helix-turn-helix domain-containing protein [Marseilla massiliensis]|uniref:helix-turn-helix domain-containing protein n=1 Tax=Marseilla massiliensis TaxID=1841864 RepID=UPI002011937C|nr:helix-turn-helix transcriptional regulator [Marseilla massiliensis]MCL1609530.1 helix-turn-helix transcriptional regulator [Marseilla massiliensis]
METINDRMEMLVNERFGGNKAAFATSIGLGPTALSNYLGNKRRSKPSVDMVAKIVKTLDVDAKWLLIGEQTANNHVSTQGNYSPATVNGDAINTSGEVELLQQRVKLLEDLLAEKERLINVLMEGRK